MKILIDTNVILDLTLESQPFYNLAVNMFSIAAQQNMICYISASSVTDIYFVTKKFADKKYADKTIENIFRGFDVVPVDKKLLEDAYKLNFHDFEDAVQHQCAVTCKADIIITRNKKDYKHSKIKVLTPIEFIKQNTKK
jgi:predicted nucleic acid-binding protein